MDLSSILKADAVKVVGSCTSKKRLFHDLGELSQGSYDLDAAEVIEALIEREGLGPTGVGHGIALPHARLEKLDRVCGLFIRLDRPIDFDAVDRQPVDLIFTLLAPANDSPEHLKALAMVSRTLRNDENCKTLRANNQSATLFSILTELTTSKAA